MKLTGLNLIGFEKSGKGDSFWAKNPSTLEELDTKFKQATVAEVQNAIQKADEAADTFRQKTNEDRAVFLETIAEEILQLGDELIDRCSQETALPAARLTGERGRTMNQLKLFAQVVREGSWIEARIDTAQPDRQPLPKPDIRQMQIPLGPVGIFGASNFPLAFSVAGGDTASALAAGCPVVVKGHPLHPGTSEMVGEAIISAAKKTGMPEGVFSLVQGPGVEVGMTMVQHPKITAIGFTGSLRGGRALFDAANKREVPIPVFAEMGSTNPVFILPGALKERGEALAKGLVGSMMLGVGQFCTNPGLMITAQSAEAQKLVKAMNELVEQSPSGAMLGEGIKSAFSAGIKRLKENAGVTETASGKQPEEGNYAQPKIFATDTSTFFEHSSLSEEVFGPSTLHVNAKDKQEIMQLASGLEGHLTATIHGTEEDLAEYAELIRILEKKVGRLIFNGYPTGVEVCHAMVHGGPYPATTAPHSTSVGTAAIKRFSRPVCYQDFPQNSLPDQLKDSNPLNIWRMVNGEFMRDSLRP